MRRPTLDTFTRAYVTCALWLLDEDPGPGEWSEHGRYTIANIHGDTLRQMVADCQRFQEDNPGNLEEAYDYGLTEVQAGHDFWLSRSGHGAGFVDHGDSACFDWLQKAARAFEEFDLYFGNTGRIYGYPIG